MLISACHFWPRILHREQDWRVLIVCSVEQGGGTEPMRAFAAKVAPHVWSWNQCHWEERVLFWGFGGWIVRESCFVSQMASCNWSDFMPNWIVRGLVQVVYVKNRCCFEDFVNDSLLECKRPWLQSGSNSMVYSHLNSHKYLVLFY